MSDKSNPLDRLTRPGGRPISDDETIPVLTERLSLPSLDLDISLPSPPPPLAAPAPAPAPAPAAQPTPAPAPATAPASRAAAVAGATAAAVPEALRTVAAPARPAPAVIPTYASLPIDVAATLNAPPATDWPRIEQSLRDALLRELQPVLADEAGRLLRERLQPAIERVLLATTAELRQAFEGRLREAIARAVAAEVARQRERG